MSLKNIVIGVLGFFALFALAIFSLWIIKISIEKNEIVECKKLESYSKEFKTFYLLAHQKAMCDAHEIHISAPIVSSYENTSQKAIEQVLISN